VERFDWRYRYTYLYRYRYLRSVVLRTERLSFLGGTPLRLHRLILCTRMNIIICFARSSLHPSHNIISRQTESGGMSTSTSSQSTTIIRAYSLRLFRYSSFICVFKSALFAMQSVVCHRPLPVPTTDLYSLWSPNCTNHVNGDFYLLLYP